MGAASASLTDLRYMETKPILPILAASRSAKALAVVVFLSPMSTEDKDGTAVSLDDGIATAKVPNWSSPSLRSTMHAFFVSR